MEIKLDGALTKEDFLRAMKLANHPILKKGQWVEIWILLLAAGAIMIGAGILGMAVMMEYFPAEIVLIAFGMIFVFIGLRLSRAAAEQWEKIEGLRAHREGVVTDDYIEMSMPTSQHHIQWKEFNGYGEYQEVVVLFQGTSLATPFSRRLFQSDSEWRQFKSLAAEKLPLSHQVNPARPGNLLVWLLIIIAIAVAVLEITQGSR